MFSGALFEGDSCLEEEIVNKLIHNSNSEFGQQIFFGLVQEKLSTSDVFVNNQKSKYLQITIFTSKLRPNLLGLIYFVRLNITNPKLPTHLLCFAYFDSKIKS